MRKEYQFFVYRGASGEALDAELQPIYAALRDINGPALARVKKLVDEARGTPLPVSRGEFAHMVEQAMTAAHPQRIQAERRGKDGAAEFEALIARHIARKSPAPADSSVAAGREMHDMLHFLGDDGARHVQSYQRDMPENAEHTRRTPKSIVFTDADRLIAPE